MEDASAGLSAVTASLPWSLPLPSGATMVSALRRLVEAAEGEATPGISWQSALDSMAEQGGRDALAEVFLQISASERTGGEVAAGAMNHLEQLLSAALRSCSEQGDAPSIVKYTRTMGLIYCVDTETDEPSYLSDTEQVMRAPLWRNLRLLEEVAWESL